MCKVQRFVWKTVVAGVKYIRLKRYCFSFNNGKGMNIRIFLKALVFFQTSKPAKKVYVRGQIKEKITIKENDNDVVNGGKCAHWSVGERGIFTVNWDDLSLMARGSGACGNGICKLENDEGTMILFS